MSRMRPLIALVAMGLGACSVRLDVDSLRGGSCDDHETSAGDCRPPEERTCAPGTYVRNAAQGARRSCEPCPSGTFSAFENMARCEPWTPCTGASVEVQPGSATRDRDCAPCDEGSLVIEGACHEAPGCPPGTFVTAGADTSLGCAVCPEDSFSKDTDALACTPARVCESGFWVLREPTKTANRECIPCGALFTSQGPNANACEVDLTVSSGLSASCILERSSGEATCFGAGLEAHGPDVPVSAVEPMKTATDAFAACGLRKKDGVPVCWGAAFGANVDVPEVPVRSLSVAAEHACAITKSHDEVVCWGHGGPAGRLIQAPSGEFASVAAGPSGNCALTAQGALHCWGDFDENPLTVTPPPNEPLRSVGVGLSFSCGLTLDDRAVCWGILGVDGSYDPPAARFASLSVGYAHACGITHEQRVLCWGLDGVPGDLGEGRVRDTPTDGSDDYFASVSAGVYHTCAVHLYTGGVQCWGTPGKEPPQELRRSPGDPP